MPRLGDTLSGVADTATSNPGQQLRRSNRQHILQLLAKRRFLSRGELCQMTGLTGAAVSRITRELLNIGLLRETKEQTKTGHLGRRQSMLSIEPSGACVIGVTITANKMEVALVDAGKNILACSRPLPVTEPDSETLVNALVREAQELITKHSHRISRLAGIGIAVPSSGSTTNDDSISSQQMGWRNVSIAQPFMESLGLPVSIEARAMSLLRAEQHQATRELPESLFLVNVGLGIGSAGILEGQFLWGSKPGFGGVAHLPHPTSEQVCVCGRVGCLEMCASGVAVARRLMKQPADLANVITPDTRWTSLNDSLNTAFKRAEAGDQEARKAFYDAGFQMGFGLDVIHSLVQPGQLYLSGATGRQQQYVDGVWDCLKQVNSTIDNTTLQVSKVRSVQGAACTALDAFVFSENLDLSDPAAAYVNHVNARECDQ